MGNKLESVNCKCEEIDNKIKNNELLMTDQK